MPDYDQIAYEAYAKHQDWKNYQGAPIPSWEAVREDIKEAWHAAIVAVIEAYEGRIAR